MESRNCPNCGAPAQGEKCEFCGAQIVQQSQAVQQGQPVSNVSNQAPQENISPCDWTVTLILSIFLGYLGIDRFYVGQIGLGVLKLLTGAGCGIWYIIDIIIIATGKFTDSQGRVIKQK